MLFAVIAMWMGCQARVEPFDGTDFAPKSESRALVEKEDDQRRIIFSGSALLAGKVFMGLGGKLAAKFAAKKLTKKVMMKLLKKSMKRYGKKAFKRLLKNAGKDCWWKCRKRDGMCSWCGEHNKGMCCRRGWRKGGCDGRVGGRRRHECIVVADDSAIKCPAGYVAKSGDIPGWGRVGNKGGGQRVSSCRNCASLCTTEAACLSYECSPTERKCNLNTARSPTHPSYKDYVFCSRG